MMKQAIISVIIPVYNSAMYITESLESALVQSLKPVEIIVIDDGSTDGLDEVLARHSKYIKLLHQENMGQSHARNRGIKLAKGSFIAFLDADDYWTNNHLELLHDLLMNDPSLDYAIGKVKNFIDGDLASANLESIDKKDGLAGFVPGAGLFRKDCFEKVGLFNEDYRLAEVIDWSARAADYKLRFGVIDQVTLMRRIHGGNNGIRRAAEQQEYLKALRASLHRRNVNKA